MPTLTQVIDHLDAVLDTANVPDYSAALNGLQLANDGQVSSVVAAVDASEPVIAKAVASGADLLIVHHGMFWQGAQKVTGAFYRKLKMAMDHGLAIYSSHIPLDIHPTHGNNILLATELGMNQAVPYGDFKGVALGVKQEMDIPFTELIERVENAVGGKVHYCPGGAGEAGMVGVITGGAGSEVQQMQELGIQTFITGEGPHWSFPLAEELRMNVIYAGHYATETFGVRKLTELLEGDFGLKVQSFIDHPTGL